ncbi:MAG: hypothetical protein OXH57_01885 [Ekhidna sp.]|nr:hypothetical protein [Ekhidna sp.]
MKKLLIASLAITSLLACNEDELAAGNLLPNSVSEIASSSDFRNVRDAQYKILESLNLALSSTEDIDAHISELEKLAKKGIHSEQDLEKLARLMGFSNAEVFQNTYQHYTLSLSKLINKYPRLINEGNYQSSVDFMISVFEHLENNSSLLSNNDCNAMYDNCTQSARAELVVIETGCAASLMVPVIGPILGPVCTIGAIGIYDAAVKQCRFDYDKCIDEM